MLKNYYEILQVEENSTHQEIKNQFRKLVRMYHPDVNSSVEAEEMFKTINKAAEVLLNEEKRRNYDKLRNINFTKPKETRKQNANRYAFSFQKEAKGNKENKEKNLPKNGEDIFVNITIDMLESIVGTTRTINIANLSACPKCRGHKFANDKKCPHCNGVGEIEETKKITVKIPPSVKNKSKLRIKNEGKKGINGGKNGNLYVVVEIKENEDFKIVNDIVYSTVYISPYTAILGGKVNVATLWGEASIKIPPLTKTNQSFKLIDVGVLNKTTGKKGEQIVKIQIQTPQSLTEEEKELYEKLKELNSKKKNANFIS